LLGLIVFLALILQFQPPGLGEAALEASGGPVDVASVGGGKAGVHDVVGTMVLLVWRGPGGTFPFVLRGPAGWNNDTPLTFKRTEHGAGTHWGWWFEKIHPVAGQYTLTTAVQGGEVTVPFTIGAGSALPRPAIRVAVDGPKKITVTWTAPTGAQSYVAVILGPKGKQEYEPVITRSTSYTFEGRELSSGEYHASVFAFNSDLGQTIPAIPKQFSASHASEAFSVP
jgi:hypothetical protein